MSRNTQTNTPAPEGARDKRRVVTAAAPLPRHRSAGRLLSNKEKAVLCQLAKVAFDKLSALDLTDGLKITEWRRREQLAAVGKEHLTDCTRDDWRPIAAHFYGLVGWSHRAFLMWMQTGKATDNSPAGDTHEAREEFLHLILGNIAEHQRIVEMPRDAAERAASTAARIKGGAITRSYVEAIARIQHGRGLEQLTAGQLENMLATTRNRIAAREGRGDARNRNKKQRQTAAAKRKELKTHGTIPRV